MRGCHYLQNESDELFETPQFTGLHERKTIGKLSLWKQRAGPAPSLKPVLGIMAKTKIIRHSGQ